MIPEKIISAERTILAHVVFHDDASILNGLKESDFSDPLHREVYRHVIEMWNGLRSININSVLEAIRVSSGADGIRSEEVSSAKFVSRFGHSDYRPERVDSSKALVLEYAVSRDFLTAVRDVTTDILRAESGHLLGDLFQIDSAILRAVSRLKNDDGSSSLQVSLGAVLDDIQTLYETKHSDPSESLRRISKIGSGLASLDEILGGLRRSSVAILIGRDETCITSLAINIALHAASEGKSVLYIKTNLGSRELARRMLSCQSRIHMARMENGDLADDDWDLICGSLKELHSASVRLMGETLTTFFEIEEQAQAMRRGHGELDLIVIDDLSELIRTLRLSCPDVDAQYVLSKVNQLADYGSRSSGRGTCIVVADSIMDSDGQQEGERPVRRDVLQRLGHQVMEIHANEQPNSGVAREVSVRVTKNLFGTTGSASCLYTPTRNGFDSLKDVKALS